MITRKQAADVLAKFGKEEVICIDCRHTLIALYKKPDGKYFYDLRFERQNVGVVQAIRLKNFSLDIETLDGDRKGIYPVALAPTVITVRGYISQNGNTRRVFNSDREFTDPQDAMVYIAMVGARIKDITFRTEISQDGGVL